MDMVAVVPAPFSFWVQRMLLLYLLLLVVVVVVVVDQLRLVEDHDATKKKHRSAPSQ
jgi:hypothetical protein